MSDSANQTPINKPTDSDISASRNRIWMGWIVIVILVVLAFTNARSLERWAASQPPNWSTETVRLMAQLWTERMQAAGFNAPRDRLNAQFEQLKSTTWSDVFGTPELTPSSVTIAPPKWLDNDFSGSTVLGAHGRECPQMRCDHRSW